MASGLEELHFPDGARKSVDDRTVSDLEWHLLASDTQVEYICPSVMPGDIDIRLPLRAIEASTLAVSIAS